MHQNIHRLAANLAVKLQALSDLFSSCDEQSQIDALTRLRVFVQSAATVLSSASTILEGNRERLSTADYSSDFGELFPMHSNETVQHWIDSQTTATSGMLEDAGVGRVIDLEDTESRQSIETVYHDACDRLQPGSLAQNAPSATEDDILQDSSINQTNDTSQNNKSGVTRSLEEPPESQILKTLTNGSAQTSIESIEPTCMGEDIATTKTRQSSSIRHHNKAKSVPGDKNVVFTTTSGKDEERSRVPSKGDYGQNYLEPILKDAKKYKPKIHRNSSRRYEMKFVLIGDGAVGKTALLTWVIADSCYLEVIQLTFTQRV
jgi:hypothetical protein